MRSATSPFLTPSESMGHLVKSLLTKVPIPVLVVMAVQILAAVLLYLDSRVDWQRGGTQGAVWVAPVAGANLLFAALLGISSLRRKRKARFSKRAIAVSVLLAVFAVASLSAHLFAGVASPAAVTTPSPGVSPAPVASTDCGPVKIHSLNSLAPQGASMDLVPHVLVEGMVSPMAKTTYVLFRSLEGGRWWRMGTRRLTDERWRAELDLPMEGATTRRFAVLAWSCESLPAEPYVEAQTVVARSPQLTIDTTVAQATELTVHGRVYGAPSRAVVCLLGRTDTTPTWKVLATAVPGPEGWTADLALRAPYEQANHFDLAGVVMDGACQPDAVEPLAAVPGPHLVLKSGQVPKPAVSLAVVSRRATPSGTQLVLRGEAEHMLASEHVWIQAFPASDRLPGVWPAVRSPEKGTWESTLELPKGEWRLYAVVFETAPFTLPRPSWNPLRVVLP